MDRHQARADVAKRAVRMQGRHRNIRGKLRGRASRYRNYGEAMRAFASKLKAPEIRQKLLQVADAFSRKAASMEAVAKSR